MEKAYIYKLTFNRPGATSWERYFMTMVPPSTASVLEALSIEHLADLQALRPNQTEQASHLRLWYDRMIEEIKGCGIPGVGPTIGTTSRKRIGREGRTTEITVEKLEAFV